MPWLEIGANAVNALSVILATRNSPHTWWIGIVGSCLFAALFFTSQLYADTLLQGFFVATSFWGWWAWLRGNHGAPAPVQHASFVTVVLGTLAAVAVTFGYGALLKHYTDAFAPFVDSAVLAFSVMAQVLLMNRRYEAWWFWLLVNTLAVPLFYSRGLYITAALYSAFWINALVALYIWRRLIVRSAGT